MTDEAFKEFMHWTRRSWLCCATLTQEQADEVKAYVQSRARDRSNLAPTVTSRTSSRAGGRPGSGCESQSSSSTPTLNS